MASIVLPVRARHIGIRRKPPNPATCQQLRAHPGTARTPTSGAPWNFESSTASREAPSLRCPNSACVRPPRIRIAGWKDPQGQLIVRPRAAPRDFDEVDIPLRYAVPESER